MAPAGGRLTDPRSTRRVTAVGAGTGAVRRASAVAPWASARPRWICARQTDWAARRTRPFEAALAAVSHGEAAALKRQDRHAWAARLDIKAARAGDW